MNNRFSSWPPWWPSWISDWNDFSYFFIYKSSQCFLLIFGVDWLLCLREESKNRFSRWPPLFFIYKSPRHFPPSLESTGLSVQEKKHKIDFQDGGHLGFPIGTILAIFVLQVNPMLPPSTEIIGPGV